MTSVLPTNTALRARVSSERWFNNVAGSSSRRRTGLKARTTPSLHGICRTAEQPPSALPRPRVTHHAKLHPTVCAVLLLILAFLAPVQAYIFTPPEFPEALQLRDILVDSRYAVAPAKDTARRRRELAPRDDNTPADSSTAKSAEKTSGPTSRFQAVSTTAFPSSASSAAASATSSGGIVAESGAPTGQLPRPFDTSLGNNFTNPSCPQFFNTFLSDPALTSCLPLSLLLMNSQSFFQDQTDPPTLHRVLDVTCSAVSANCANIMSNYAFAITQQSNCGADLAAQNPIAQRAHAGFLSYQPLYDAGCLKADPVAVSAKTPSEYCFAATSQDDGEPADQYIYYLALGVPLPGGARPSCSSCTQRTMQIFAGAAQNMSSPLSATYTDAATQINSRCGPNWVNATVKPIEGSAPTSAGAPTLGAGTGAWFAMAAAAAAAVLFV